MKRNLITLLLCLVSGMWALAATSQPQKYELKSGGEKRTYSMYLPSNLKEGAPLLIYTHGYGSKSRWKKDLNKVADREGFAVCYPDGFPDAKGKDGWNVGYPPQKDMKIDEVKFFKDLKKEVCKKFKLSSENVFMTGMSNGGDLCYQLAFTAPGLFKGYASVAGLLFDYAYLNNPLPQPVPFMEIHGDSDKTSYWEGDPEGKGGWGPYSSVPMAVGVMAGANRCRYIETEIFPTLRDPERKVVKSVYKGSPMGYDVELYKIEGGPHSWGDKDVPTAELIWSYFSRFVN